ncbi:hypothetical protein DKX38_020933 [Salix brachista]|uniref:Uncharacterized protein n=1 Tax=Salix brachista TaxID=2182728 RepID=A0A5N5K832_9ROSI|nr:hypothetical protein DKX38_020933 [Salix brachista]
MNPRTDKIVRRTTMVATAVASYFLLTADYGPQPNAVEPVGSCVKMNDANAVDAIPFKFLSIKIKRAILSAQSSVKEFIFGSGKGP